MKFSLNAIGRLIPRIRDSERQEFAKWLMNINRFHAQVMGVLLLVFACGITVVIFSGGGDFNARVYIGFALSSAIGTYFTRRGGGLGGVGEVLILLTAYVWFIYALLESKPSASGEALAAFSIAMAIGALFRYMPPILSGFVDTVTWLGFTSVLLFTGFDISSFISSLFVVIAVFFMQVRLYRGICAEFRNQKLVAELEVNNRELTRTSNTDALTDLLNRRSFRSYSIDWSQDPNARSLSLILFDIDHFKHYNDTYGHPEGDNCLQSVALAVRDVLRADSLAFRVGGEEFAVMLKCSADEANILAQRLLESVRSRCRVTISLGVATAVTGTFRFEDLYAAADKALYRAKGGGRNRIERAQELRSANALL